MDRKFFKSYEAAARYAVRVYGYRYKTALAQLMHYGELRCTCAMIVAIDNGQVVVQCGTRASSSLLHAMRRLRHLVELTDAAGALLECLDASNKVSAGDWHHERKALCAALAHEVGP